VVGISFMPEGIDPTGRMSRDIPITEIAEQFEYVADKIGVDHVAFGSDLDGTDLPYCIKDVTDLHIVIKALMDRGFDRTSLEKIAHKNWIRVFKNTWKL